MSPRKKKNASSRKKRISKLRVFLLVLLTLFLVVAIGGTVVVAKIVAQTPKWNPESLSELKQSSVVYDKDGDQIAQLHADENRLVAKSSEIPKLVKDTFVAVEDKRFYSHFGVDPVRIIGSAIEDIKTRSKKEGASTITIQLARNAFIANPTSKTFTRKIQEAALAVQLEHEYTKDQILTFYLNKIFLGENSDGIKAAALTYFGESDLNKLTPDEVALLAGLPQAPSSYDPYVHPDQAKTRRNIVLGVMKDAGIIDEAEYKKDIDAPFTYVDDVQKNKGGVEKTTTAGAGYKFPYFVDYVIQELEDEYNLSPDQIYSGGLKIYTTVDPKIQAAAETVFSDPANFPKGTSDKEVQAGMTLLEPSTGAIRAIVGGREYTPRGFNRATQATRQPGSTIKPLVVYGPAIEKGGYFPGTVLDDMPVEYNGGDGKTWAPVDFDTESKGWKGLITMRYALRYSVNVFAVKLFDQIGIDYGWQFGKDRLGLPLKDSDKHLSLALGTTEVSTLDMASAYGVYANDGVRVTKHAIIKVTDSLGNEVVTPTITRQRVMKETTAYIINDMLHSVVTSGTGTKAQIGNWYNCGKTGTTSLDPDKFGNRTGSPDAWFAGYNSKYAAVVWMGYDVTDKNHYLHNVFGGSFPAQIWNKVMTVALQGQEVQTSIPKPAGIVSGKYDMKSGLLPSSLTPPQFIGTDIAAAGDFPTKVSDVWVEKEVDKSHPGMLATPNTPNKLKKVFLVPPARDPVAPWPPDEVPYKLPTGYAPDPANSPATSDNPDTASSDIPQPTLGTVNYNSSNGKVTIPLNISQSDQTYSLILHLKRPGQSNDEILNPDGIIKGSVSITVSLTEDNKLPVPGQYEFWAELTPKDDNTIKGPASNKVYLNIP